MNLSSHAKRTENRGLASGKSSLLTGKIDARAVKR